MVFVPVVMLLKDATGNVVPEVVAPLTTLLEVPLPVLSSMLLVLLFAPLTHTPAAQKLLMQSRNELHGCPLAHRRGQLPPHALPVLEQLDVCSNKWTSVKFQRWKNNHHFVVCKGPHRTNPGCAGCDRNTITPCHTRRPNRAALWASAPTIES